MTLTAGYFSHWWRVLLLRHNFSGVPKSANAPFWLLFAFYYTLSFTRWAPSTGLGWAIFEPIGVYCTMWLFFPAPVRFLWMFVSCTSDLIALFAMGSGLFDPNTGAVRFVLVVLEYAYCFFYTVKFLKSQR